MARSYYLAPWRWDAGHIGEGAWLPPVGAICAVDLRPIAAMAEVGGLPQGWCFAGFDSTPADVQGWISLGEGLPGAVNKADLKAALQTENIEAGTVLDALWEVLTVQADPLGSVRAKPLMPTVAGHLDLHLSNHSLVKRERFRWGEHPATSVIRDVVQRGYRDLRADAVRRRSDIHLKHLDWLAAKYRVDYRNFIPADLPDEGTRRRATTITDDFDRADAGSLGSSDEGWSWTATSGAFSIVSNHFEETGQNSFAEARAETDLSGDDMDAQVECLASAGTATTDNSRALVRFNPSARTHYGIIGYGVSGTATFLYKRVAGAFTALGTTTVYDVRGSVIKVRADGSTITAYVDGVSVDSATDSAITGYVRSGIAAQNVGEGDNFTAADLGGGATVVVGLSTETDSAFGVSWAKAMAVGQATETDAGLAVTARRAYEAGLAAEADAAQAVTAAKALAAGLAAEADAAQAVTARRAHAAGLAAETDAGQAVAASKAMAIGLAGETDTAIGVVTARVVPVGLASETSAALAVAAAKARVVALAEEADAALAVAASKAAAAGLAAETAAAFGVTAQKVFAAGLAVEASAALAVAAAKLRAVGLALETDSALALVGATGIEMTSGQILTPAGARLLVEAADPELLKAARVALGPLLTARPCR